MHSYSHLMHKKHGFMPFLKKQVLYLYSFMSEINLQIKCISASTKNKKYERLQIQSTLSYLFMEYL